MCPIVPHLVERRVPSLAVAAKKSAIHRFPCHAQRAFALWAAPGRACQEREPPRTTAGACLSSSSPPRRHEAITRHAEPRSVRVSWSRPTGWPSAGRHGDRAAVGSHRRDRQEGCDRATRVPHRKIERDREVREDPERQHHDRKGQKANTQRSSRYVRVRAQTGPFYRRSTSPASPLAPSSRAAPKTNDVVEHHAERLALLCGGARLARPRGLAPTRGGMPND